MKKLSLLLIALCLFVGFATNDVFARAIGIKGGYTMPRNDLKDYDDEWAFGVYFDMGTFLINNLDFRPSIDMFSLENSDTDTKLADVWGIHFDWYWHFLDKGSISPFIGFGPVLNYYDFDEDRDDNEDSDAGVDLFLGLDINISGPLSLMVEGRYKFLDIAARDQNAMQVNLGVAYSF
ncbi:MAG TPA: outer membrane beta-barrel protein [Spirochaetota bacterium]|nr:outer membrane beta-barrel protein [Spirochaetota bacterium]HPS88252.1 outer membrane beta-barrel protein [Spirochaetota bacterium]